MVTLDIVISCAIVGLEAASIMLALVRLLLWTIRLYQRDELAGWTVLYMAASTGWLCLEFRLYQLYFRELCLFPPDHHRHLSFFNETVLWWLVIPKVVCIFLGGSLYGWFIHEKKTKTFYSNLVQATLLATILLPLLALWLRLCIFLYFIQFA